MCIHSSHEFPACPASSFYPGIISPPKWGHSRADSSSQIDNLHRHMVQQWGEMILAKTSRTILTLVKHVLHFFKIHSFSKRCEISRPCLARPISSAAGSTYVTHVVLPTPYIGVIVFCRFCHFKIDLFKLESFMSAFRSSNLLPSKVNSPV